MSEVVDKILTEGITSVQEAEYRQLVRDATSVLEKENLVKKDWKDFVVVGDCHGNLDTAITASEFAIERGIPIIFLGDYVDRGRSQLETLAYVLGLKVKRPEKTVLLKGNHETERMNRNYGFYRVIQSSYSMFLYDEILKFYHELPVSSVVNRKYFMVHGGVPEGIEDIDEIDDLERNSEPYKEMFWNDPDEGLMDFKTNYMRGGYKLYGSRAVDEFLRKNDLKMIIRAHQCFPKGYKYFFGKKLLTVFSVPNYCGNDEGVFAHISGVDINLKSI